MQCIIIIIICCNTRRTYFLATRAPFFAIRDCQMKRKMGTSCDSFSYCFAQAVLHGRAKRTRRARTPGIYRVIRVKILTYIPAERVSCNVTSGSLRANDRTLPGTIIVLIREFVGQRDVTDENVFTRAAWTQRYSIQAKLRVDRRGKCVYEHVRDNGSN